MLTIRRRLFWRVYITLMISLLLVAVLIFGAWRVLLPSPWARMGELRIRLADTLVLSSPSGERKLQEIVDQLGDESGAQISVFTPEGQLLASYGDVLPRPAEMEDRQTRRRERIMRLSLDNGRIVLARLNPPSAETELRFLILVSLSVLGVGMAAYPVTARLTLRLENLRGSVEAWGGGDLAIRAPESGHDEVARVAQTFNTAAQRIEALLASQKALLANASHELRSPLARLRMAVELWSQMPTDKARRIVEEDLAEVDRLVEEILLASRLDHLGGSIVQRAPVDLTGLAAEEAARVGAQVEGVACDFRGDVVLLRRLMRNLLENAVKHGHQPIEIAIAPGEGKVAIMVSDHGAGVAEGERERVFQPFYRPAGRSEQSGGWGLGLSLVRQITELHGGSVRCSPLSGGGTVFVATLPMEQADQGH